MGLFGKLGGLSMKFFGLDGALFIRSFGLLGGLFMELFGWLGGPFLESFGLLEGLFMELFGLLGVLFIDLKKSCSVALDVLENKQVSFISGLFWIVLAAECLLRLTMVHLLAVLVVSIFSIGTKWLTWNSFDLSAQPDVLVIIIVMRGSCCRSLTLGL